MTKFKIFIWHLVVFIVGSVGLVAYTFIRINSLQGGAALGGTITMPAIMIFYIAVFFVLCLISFTISLIIRYFH